jgi:guanine deaminase
MTREETFMMEAVRLSQQAIDKNEGGPFGCVIVKDDRIIGRGNNRVTVNNDPTAHAEIIAIRDACTNLGSFQLAGCEIYTSCEPCPMCLGAIYWARPAVVYYANSRYDAASIGFDDAQIYKEVASAPGQRKIMEVRLSIHEALVVFENWMNKQNKHLY